MRRLRAHLCVALLLATTAAAGSARAQRVLSLQDCIQLAMARNLQLQQQAVVQDNSQLNLRQAQLNYLPSLNGNVNANRQFGTTFDSFTFTRTNQATSTLRFSANASLPLFEGLSRYYSLQQQQASQYAEQANARKQENQVLTRVLSLYLQRVLDEATLRISGERLALIRRQLEQAQRRQAAGATTEAEVLNLKGQLATEQRSQMQAQNQHDRNQLLLLHALLLGPDTSYVFLTPDTASLPLDAPMPPLSLVQQQAMAHMPELTEAEQRLRAAQLGSQVSRASLSPRLSFNAGLGSNYSSNVEDLLGEQGNLRNQLDDNLFQSIGLSLDIPLFNGYQARNNWQLAKNQVRTASLNRQLVEQQLQQDVQQAWLDVRAAREQHQATSRQLEALSLAYQFAEKRYEAGALDFYAYIEALNRYNQAQIDLLQAHFEYYFRQKILLLYQGTPLSF
ncbi:MAG: TolC family protein [Bacteroidetes bacterium]|nr:TolC family protein [Bacteroidota bacterium]